MRRVQSASLNGAICLPKKVSFKYGNSGLIQDQSRVQIDVTEDQSGCYQNIQHNISISESDDVLLRITEGHKTTLKNKYKFLYEGVTPKGNQTLLNSIYTELYITEGESEGVNDKHEILRIETASRKWFSQDKPISCNDIFKPLTTNRTKEHKKALSSQESGRDRQKPEIRTVLTKGIAGIGKTVSVQKFILDWAEGRIDQDIDFMLVLPLRELNLVKDEQFSLHGLLLEFHPELKDLDPKKYNDFKMLFIFDGLDESRLQLSFSESLNDVTKTSSVNMLISNLIQGNLLPFALIWITSRPAAANQIPSQFISHVTEIQGFSDSQKVEYFRKRVSDKSQASRIISHIKSSVSLHIMCHIPVFCWISATVLQEMLHQDNVKEIPKTLTEMYIHFLLIQTKMKKQKYEQKIETDSKILLESSKEIFLKLAKLAFNQLLRGNIMFYEEDLRESGIDVSEATVCSGICTEIFKEESVLRQKKVYCFVHLSVQEFFAALYVFYCYINKNMEALEYFLQEETRVEPRSVPLDELLRKAVDKSLESKDGHLDLFVRFLHGISLESNQKLLQGLLTHTQNNQEGIKKISRYIKKLNKDGVPPERWINLLHCLTEMNDHSLHEEIQAFVKSGNYRSELSLAHCTALAYMFLMSEEVLDEFDLKKYKTSDEGHRRLVPAVRCCRKAQLRDNKLTQLSCETIASALKSVNCPLRELDLSNTGLQDSGVTMLCAALKNPNCKLEILRLALCKLTEQSCSSIASVLQSVNCPLRELDLSNNDLQDSGVKSLCVGLNNPHCKLEILRLTLCKLTEQSCEAVASVLQSVNCPLRELDLSNNDLQDSGVKFLCVGLKNPHCKLEILRLRDYKLTQQSCETIASALMSVNCPLRELDLSNTGLQDSGVTMLCAALKNPNCQLEILRLAGCKLTEQSCEAVASVLQSVNCPLRELDLNNNDLQDSGVKFLCEGVKNPHCKLEILRLSGCLVTEEGCSSLASALSSNPSHLRELDLSYNHPGDSGMKQLPTQMNQHFQLKSVLVDHGGEFMIKPGLRKYACDLTLDLNTVNTKLSLSEGNRKVTYVPENQSYPDHPERFDIWGQVMCRESLTARCYWESEWSGDYAVISVTCKEISRKGLSDDCKFGLNEKSWSLWCSDNSYIAIHNKHRTSILHHPSSTHRVGVYLDWSSGTVSFYSVSSDTHTLTHLHTFHCTFTEPLYAGFGFYVSRSSVSLYANFTYSKQALLDINNRCTNIVLDFPFNFGELPPELERTPRSVRQLIPTGSVRWRHRDRKQRRGKRGGLRARLRLNPHRQALPSIFLANARSLANKLDERGAQSSGLTELQWRMWQGIQNITDYKPPSTVPPSSSASLPDELNHFYARFDRENKEVTLKADLPPGELPLSLSSSDVCATLSRFAYHTNRSAEDAVSMALHSALTHLDSSNSYVRMLFIDFSSAFNTVIPSKLISKLSQLGISTSLGNWTLDFLTNRPQSVKLDYLTSSTLTLNTSMAQGCVLSPLLYSLFTYDCIPVHGTNTIIKFADDTTVVGLIREDDETAYRDEVEHLAAWCADNNLALNTQKTKEIIVDFRRARSKAHAPIYIDSSFNSCGALRNWVNESGTDLRTDSRFQVTPPHTSQYPDCQTPAERQSLEMDMSADKGN
ncbi:NACHT, LRR and PYD domains-containing protein 12-like [Chanos chanos]|uniref:NACHT, LRR and PYD domains-containing protein 12-like n=1 Tax=Chanos chanos TaxID=29144 RepID=A0A6J2WAI8_CHACN|nr:NACHT, LRR and PYD domains-containing protein 12-like [Chanos chanos]